MSAHDGKPNGHAFDLTDWPDQDDDEEIRSVKRHVGMLVEEVRTLRESIDSKFDQLIALAKATRGDVIELHEKWVRILDRQIEQAKNMSALDERVVAIESRRKPKPRK